MPQPTSTKTVQDVLSYVTEQFGDVASVEIDSTKLIRWTNLAILEICTKDSKAYQGRFTVSSVVGQAEYTYPSNLLHVMMIKFDTNRPLTPIGFEEVQYQTGDAFTTESGTPMYWSHQANFFQLWPAPSTVKTITIYGAAKPAELTVAADALPLSDRYFPMICGYVLSEAQKLDEDYQASAATRTLFEDQVKIGQNQADSMQGQYAVMDDPDSYYYDSSGLYYG